MTEKCMCQSKLLSPQANLPPPPSPPPRVLTINPEVEDNYSNSPLDTIFWNLFSQKERILTTSIWFLKHMQTVSWSFGENLTDWNGWKNKFSSLYYPHIPGSLLLIFLECYRKYGDILLLWCEPRFQAEPQSKVLKQLKIDISSKIFPVLFKTIFFSF